MQDWKTGDRLTFKLGEHTFKTPPIPKKEDILFHEYPKEMQFWRRVTDFGESENRKYNLYFLFEKYDALTKIDSDYTQVDGDEVKSLGRKDSQKLAEIRERELHRRANGVWFMNNGVPTYLTGGHYFALQWCKMKGVKNPFDGGSSYGTYRRFQRDVFYFWQLCKDDTTCAGGYVTKPKKTGITIMLALDILNTATMTPEFNIGIMSKTHDDNKKANFGFIKFSFDRLPYIFKPTTGGDNKTILEFNNPRVKNTGSKAAQLKAKKNSEGFDTFIYAAPTVANAFDGPVYNILWLDEFPKFEDPYPQETYDATIKCIKLGEELNGKMFITSYVVEKDGRSFTEGRKIYMECKLATRDKLTGLTKSELYCYHISTIDSLTLNLPNINNQFDKYGEVNRDINENYISLRRDQLSTDRAALQTYMRQFPRTEEEAWRIGGGGGSAFDNIRLGKRHGEIKAELDAGNRNYLEGNLEWVNGRMGEVRFIRTPEEDILKGKSGKFRLYGIDIIMNGPLAGKFNIPFKEDMRDDWSRLKPRLTTPFIISTDPTDYMLKSDAGVGSKNAITAMTFHDPAVNAFFGRIMTNKFFLRYLYRPENPQEYYEDLVKTILWLGAYAYVENNKPWVATKMKEDELHNFLLVRDIKSKSIVPYDEWEHKNVKPTTANKETINEMVRQGEVYMAPASGHNDVDMIEHMEDDTMIEQLMTFDVEDTKKYDLAVCALSNIVAKNSFEGYKAAELSRDDGYDPSDLNNAVKAAIY